MFELSIAGDFSSAHFLKGYQGSCQNLHGHTWKVEVTIFASQLNDIGLVFDFRELKKKLHAFLETMDHKCLNDLPAFKQVNPSTETIARHVYQEFGKLCLPFRIKNVRVWESDHASITYYE
jgi:6-pyruvoyltetrahydropterin/6-carboxytetrahydropterin synthase